MKTISKILKNDLCLGCGLCEALDKENCKMRLDKEGFYRPAFFKESMTIEKSVKKLCPGICVVSRNQDSNKSVWGRIVKVSNAWACDKYIRKGASSGGVTSALATYLLEKGLVNGILHIGTQEGSYLYNKLFISRTREDILKKNASRYAPASVFNDIFDILDSYPQDSYAFIGKPCDIAAMQNIVREFPQYAGRVKYYLSIFCAGMPGYEATKRALATFGKKEEPVILKYRGDGWPGFFKATYSDGSICKMTYNESWGNILGRRLGFRCKICPDGIGMLADISSGDSWNTKDGYPDFTEGDGRNFCFIRTERGAELFEDAQNAGYIHVEELNVENVKDMQRYQYNRRILVGWRIAIVQCLSGGLLSFHGLGFYRTAVKGRLFRGIRESYGTAKRFTKARKKNGEQ